MFSKHLKYLKYILRHKFFVLQECYKEGILLRGILHDLSKFRPSEWIPYADYFYGKYPSVKDVYGDARIHISKFKETVEEEFNEAWLKHIHSNPHHWQYWILREDNGSIRVLPMSDEYRKEMLADWKGAGKAINGYDDTLNWYKKNRKNIILHPETREWIEDELGYEEEMKVKGE